MKLSLALVHKSIYFPTYSSGWLAFIHTSIIAYITWRSTPIVQPFGHLVVHLCHKLVSLCGVFSRMCYAECCYLSVRLSVRPNALNLSVRPKAVCPSFSCFPVCSVICTYFISAYPVWNCCFSLNLFFSLYISLFLLLNRPIIKLHVLKYSFCDPIILIVFRKVTTFIIAIRVHLLRSLHDARIKDCRRNTILVSRRTNVAYKLTIEQLIWFELYTSMKTLCLQKKSLTADKNSLTSFLV